MSTHQISSINSLFDLPITPPRITTPIRERKEIFSDLESCILVPFPMPVLPCFQDRLLEALQQAGKIDGKGKWHPCPPFPPPSSLSIEGIQKLHEWIGSAFSNQTSLSTILEKLSNMLQESGTNTLIVISGKVIWNILGKCGYYADLFSYIDPSLDSLRASKGITSSFDSLDTKLNRLERGTPFPCGKGDEEGRFGEVAASPNEEVIPLLALSHSTPWEEPCTHNLCEIQLVCQSEKGIFSSIPINLFLLTEFGMTRRSESETFFYPFNTEKGEELRLSIIEDSQFTPPTETPFIQISNSPDGLCIYPCDITVQFGHVKDAWQLILDELGGIARSAFLPAFIHQITEGKRPLDVHLERALLSQFQREMERETNRIKPIENGFKKHVKTLSLKNPDAVYILALQWGITLSLRQEELLAFLKEVCSQNEETLHEPLLQEIHKLITNGTLSLTAVQSLLQLSAWSFFYIEQLENSDQKPDSLFFFSLTRAQGGFRCCLSLPHSPLCLSLPFYPSLAALTLSRELKVATKQNQPSKILEITSSLAPLYQKLFHSIDLIPYSEKFLEGPWIEFLNTIESLLADPNPFLAHLGFTLACTLPKENQIFKKSGILRKLPDLLSLPLNLNCHYGLINKLLFAFPEVLSLTEQVIERGLIGPGNQAELTQITIEWLIEKKMSQEAYYLYRVGVHQEQEIVIVLISSLVKEQHFNSAICLLKLLNEEEKISSEKVLKGAQQTGVSLFSQQNSPEREMQIIHFGEALVSLLRNSRTQLPPLPFLDQLIDRLINGCQISLAFSLWRSGIQKGYLVDKTRVDHLAQRLLRFRARKEITSSFGLAATSPNHLSSSTFPQGNGVPPSSRYSFVSQSQNEEVIPLRALNQNALFPGLICKECIERKIWEQSSQTSLSVLEITKELAQEKSLEGHRLFAMGISYLASHPVDSLSFRIQFTAIQEIYLEDVYLLQKGEEHFFNSLESVWKLIKKQVNDQDRAPALFRLLKTLSEDPSPKNKQLTLKILNTKSSFSLLYENLPAYRTVCLTWLKHVSLKQEQELLLFHLLTMPHFLLMQKEEHCILAKSLFSILPTPFLQETLKISHSALLTQWFILEMTEEMTQLMIYLSAFLKEEEWDDNIGKLLLQSFKKAPSLQLVSLFQHLIQKTSFEEQEEMISEMESFAIAAFENEKTELGEQILKSLIHLEKLSKKREYFSHNRTSRFNLVAILLKYTQNVKIGKKLIKEIHGEGVKCPSIYLLLCENILEIHFKRAQFLSGLSWLNGKIPNEFSDFKKEWTKKIFSSLPLKKTLFFLQENPQQNISLWLCLLNALSTTKKKRDLKKQCLQTWITEQKTGLPNRISIEEARECWLKIFHISTPLMVLNYIHDIFSELKLLNDPQVVYLALHTVLCEGSKNSALKKRSLTSLFHLRLLFSLETLASYNQKGLIHFQKTIDLPLIKFMKALIQNGTAEKTFSYVEIFLLEGEKKDIFIKEELSLLWQNFIQKRLENAFSQENLTLKEMQAPLICYFSHRSKMPADGQMTFLCFDFAVKLNLKILQKHHCLPLFKKNLNTLHALGGICQGKASIYRPLVENSHLMDPDRDANFKYLSESNFEGYIPEEKYFKKGARGGFSNGKFRLDAGIMQTTTAIVIEDIPPLNELDLILAGNLAKKLEEEAFYDEQEKNTLLEIVWTVMTHPTIPNHPSIKHQSIPVYRAFWTIVLRNPNIDIENIQFCLYQFCALYQSKFIHPELSKTLFLHLIQEASLAYLRIHETLAPLKKETTVELICTAVELIHISQKIDLETLGIFAKQLIALNHFRAFSYASELIYSHKNSQEINQEWVLKSLSLILDFFTQAHKEKMKNPHEQEVRAFFITQLILKHHGWVENKSNYLMMQFLLSFFKSTSFFIDHEPLLQSLTSQLSNGN